MLPIGSGHLEKTDLNAQPLVHRVLDGAGGARFGAGAPGETDAPTWIHLDWMDASAREWVEARGFDPIALEALLAEDTRPRATAFEEGVLVNLRGVNFNRGQPPESLISLRIWFVADRLYTAARQDLRTVTTITRQLEHGRGPESLAALVLALVEGLNDGAEAIVEDIEEAVDGLEADLLAEPDRTLRNRVAETRREIVVLRRYLAPQRDALVRLSGLRTGLFDEGERLELREQADRLTRLVEDLDMARERGAMIHEQLLGLLSDAMNARMYLLSIVAAVFLPLGFLTGLFGINVGGMPWTERPWGFALVAVIMVVLGGLQWWWLKRRSWL